MARTHTIADLVRAVDKAAAKYDAPSRDILIAWAARSIEHADFERDPVALAMPIEAWVQVVMETGKSLPGLLVAGAEVSRG